jgi:exodeoxyribonuclease V gamma subunit
MIEAWASGKSYLPNHAEEAWQRGLWAMLHASAKNDEGLLPGRLKASPDLAKAIPSVLVIGSGSLDPLLVDVLLRLQPCGCEVDVRIVLPCLGFLEDLRKKTLQTPSRIPEEGDPESFEFHQDLENNPLLVSMGRQAAGAFVLLGKLDEQYSNWDEQFPGTPPATLLGHLQRGIQDNQGYENLDLPADSSLRIHACYGPRRELEVLRDELLRAFADIKDLKPEEVLIAVPSLEHYAPLVSAVFHTKENPLPVRLTELPASEGDEVLEGLLALLEMALGGRGRASEVLDLMQLRAVREALGVGDDEEKLEFLADKFRDSGITQGFAASDEHPGDWSFSINRLVSGVFFGPQEPEISEVKGFQLPVADSMGSNYSEMGTFLQWLADLRSTLIEWQTAETPKHWAERLKHAAKALLAGEDGRMAAADKCLRFLSNLEFTTPVDTAVVLDWLHSETDEANRRAPITGATPFGRLKQLHNTPCRVLALVGMQNNNFPSRTVSPSWDLLRAKPKIWDRNARVDDRQMFLDAVLAPTDRLIITASTQNIRTNKSQPFSTCVDELLAAAQKLGAERKGLILEHPLQPFSAKYFEPGSKLGKPFGEIVREIAVAANNSSKELLPFYTEASPDETQPLLEITVAQLAAFWKSPARGYLKAQKIDLPMEEEDDNTLDFSPIHLDPLQQWKLKDSILKDQFRETPNESRSKALAAADRGLPPGYLADREWQVFQTMQAIADEVKKASPKDKMLGVEISGCLISCPVQLAGETLLVGDCGNLKEPKHFLSHWLAALVAAASDLPGGMRIFYVGDPVSESVFPAINPVDAKTILKEILDGYMQGQHRPLRFALRVSHSLVGTDRDFLKAKALWSKSAYGDSPQAGEGLSPASLLAWRDIDPFADQEEWMRWAQSISQPLEIWKESKIK